MGDAGIGGLTSSNRSLCVPIGGVELTLNPRFVDDRLTRDSAPTRTPNRLLTVSSSLPPILGPAGWLQTRVAAGSCANTGRREGGIIPFV